MDCCHPLKFKTVNSKKLTKIKNDKNVYKRQL